MRLKNEGIVIIEYESLSHDYHFTVSFLHSWKPSITKDPGWGHREGWEVGDGWGPGVHLEEPVVVVDDEVPLCLV